MIFFTFLLCLSTFERVFYNHITVHSWCSACMYWSVFWLGSCPAGVHPSIKTKCFKISVYLKHTTTKRSLSTPLPSCCHCPLSPGLLSCLLSPTLNPCHLPSVLQPEGDLENAILILSPFHHAKSLKGFPVLLDKFQISCLIKPLVSHHCLSHCVSVMNFFPFLE